MVIPDFIRNAKNGDCLTTKYGSIILVQRVEIEDEKNVRVYFYFDYDKSEKVLSMNEWLQGFYGPKFDDAEFYRPSTDEERQFILDKIHERGYRWNDDLKAPSPTVQEYHRILGIDKWDEISKVLSLGFMHVLDEMRPEEKMCLSNVECFDIEKAFKERDFAKLSRYIARYSPKREEAQL